VDGTAQKPYPSIQNALPNLQPGNEVVVSLDGRSIQGNVTFLVKRLIFNETIGRFVLVTAPPVPTDFPEISTKLTFDNSSDSDSEGSFAGLQRRSVSNWRENRKSKRSLKSSESSDLVFVDFLATGTRQDGSRKYPYISLRTAVRKVDLGTHFQFTDTDIVLELIKKSFS